MSTWHQRQRPVRLWSEDTWNVVINPPNSMMCVMKFTDAAAAYEFCRRTEHSYILKPQPTRGEQQ